MVPENPLLNGVQLNKGIQGFRTLLLYHFPSQDKNNLKKNPYFAVHFLDDETLTNLTNANFDSNEYETEVSS